eukprot:UN12869
MSARKKTTKRKKRTHLVQAGIDEEVIMVLLLLGLLLLFTTNSYQNHPPPLHALPTLPSTPIVNNAANILSAFNVPAFNVPPVSASQPVIAPALRSFTTTPLPTLDLSQPTRSRVGYDAPNDHTRLKVLHANEMITDMKEEYYQQLQQIMRFLSQSFDFYNLVIWLNFIFVL